MKAATTNGTAMLNREPTPGRLMKLHAAHELTLMAHIPGYSFPGCTHVTGNAVLLKSRGRDTMPREKLMQGRKMSSGVHIRTATTADAAVLLEIYRPYVETTAVSFELTVPSVQEFGRRISVAVEGWSWLVAEADGRLVGYAYGSTHRPREAYRTSVETSAYVREDYFRQGIGRALYTRLLNELRERGFGSAFAGITLPNDASVAFHESLGFKPIGVFPRVGRKFGRWHDVAWFYRPIQDSVPDIQ